MFDYAADYRENNPRPIPDGNLEVFLIDDTRVVLPFASMKSHKVEDGCLIVFFEDQRVYTPLTQIKAWNVHYNSDEVREALIEWAKARDEYTQKEQTPEERVDDMEHTLRNKGYL